MVRKKPQKLAIQKTASFERRPNWRQCPVETCKNSVQVRRAFSAPAVPTNMNLRASRNAANLTLHWLNLYSIVPCTLPMADRELDPQCQLNPSPIVQIFAPLTSARLLGTWPLVGPIVAPHSHVAIGREAAENQVQIALTCWSSLSPPATVTPSPLVAVLFGFARLTFELQRPNTELAAARIN